MKYLFAFLALLVPATAVHSQTLILGAGYADYSDSSSEDQAIISVEYQHNPFHEATRFSATWGGVATVDADGDFHLGLGLIGFYTFADRWFLEGSIMPGYYHAGNDLNDLGGDFQIRSLLGLGYTLNNGNKLSLAASHKSNASTEDDNPGVNELQLRYHIAF
ncbi:MAG: acyloxyacyl hydrolase [Ruegeria sp.]